VCPKRFISLWYVQRKSCTYLASRLALSPNGQNRAFTWASSPRSTIGCVQNDFWAYGMLGPNRAYILHRHQHYLQTDQNKIPHDPRHHGALSSAPKMIPEYVISSAQTMHLSCQDYHYLRMHWIELPLEPHHLGVPSGVSKMIYEPKVRLAQIVHLSCTDTNTVSKRTKTRFDLSHVI
jgi:hypothetical protein